LYGRRKEVKFNINSEFDCQGLDEPRLNPYVRQRFMRIVLYLVALLTGLCAVDRGQAAQPAPAVVGALHYSTAKPVAHHQAIIAEKLAIIPAQEALAQAPSPQSDRQLAITIFSFTTPVDRSDQANR
jgi:hypothetical protein